MAISSEPRKVIYKRASLPIVRRGAIRRHDEQLMQANEALRVTRAELEKEELPLASRKRLVGDARTWSRGRQQVRMTT
jgi:hypothetical protein